MSKFFTDDKGINYAQVAENDDLFFLVPFTTSEDGGEEYDFENIKAFSKEEPDYPLEKVVSYAS